MVVAPERHACSFPTESLVIPPTRPSGVTPRRRCPLINSHRTRLREIPRSSTTCPSVRSSVSRTSAGRFIRFILQLSVDPALARSPTQSVTSSPRSAPGSPSGTTTPNHLSGTRAPTRSSTASPPTANESLTQVTSTGRAPSYTHARWRSRSKPKLPLHRRR